MKTIWDNITLKEFPRLDSNLSTDILVIGGGICGILCAHMLAQTGKKVILVEKDRLSQQRTHKTTAVATSLQDLYYSDIEKHFGLKVAQQYYEINQLAIKEYQKLSNRYDFDYQEVSTFKYFSDKQKYLNEQNTLKKINCEFKAHDTWNNSQFSAIEFPHQCQFHPLMLIQNLIEGLEIYEHTPIIKLNNGIAYTPKNKIYARHIIVCTGYPFLRFRGLFFTKLTQSKSYVMAIETSKKYPSAIGENLSDLYFRNYHELLLLGGNDQKTGHPSDGYAPLEKYLKENNLSSPTCQWINQDTCSADGLPYIGKYGHFQNVYVATGFNLWGMTGSMISALIIKDDIFNKSNQYAKLFSPKRKTPFLKLLQNIKTATLNLLKFKKRCTHLGCALYFNDKEQCYECPCHGSKYDLNGKVIYNPGEHDKK